MRPAVRLRRLAFGTELIVVGLALTAFSLSVDLRTQLLASDIDGSILDPSLALSRALHSWSFHSGLGNDNTPAIGQIPVYSFEAALQHLGLSSGSLQWITYGLIFLCIPLAMMFFLRTVFPERNVVTLIGGLASVFNFYVYLTWFTPVLEYEFGLIGVPLIAAAIMRLARHWDWPSLLVVIAASIATYGAGANLAVGLVMLCAALTLGLVGASFAGVGRLRVIAPFGVVVGISCGWLFPTIAFFLTQHANLTTSSYAAQWTDGTLKATSDASTPLNLLRLIGTWNWDHADQAGHPYVPGAALYEQNPLGIALSFLLPILVASAAMRRDRKALLGFFIALIVALFFMKGTATPLGGAFAWLFTHVPGFIMFRHPYSKFGVAATPLLVILAALGAEYLVLRTRPNLQTWAAAALATLVVASIVPDCTGRMFRRTGFADMPSYYVRFPAGYRELAAYLRREPERLGRVLVLPFSPVISYTTFVWGYNGPDPLPYIIDRPVIVEPRSWSDPYTALALEHIDSDVRRLRRAIDVADIHFAVIHGDVDSAFYGATSPRLSEQLVRDVGGVFIRSFGDLKLFEFRRPAGTGSELELDRKATRVGGLAPEEMVELSPLSAYRLVNDSNAGLLVRARSLEAREPGIIKLPQVVRSSPAGNQAFQLDESPGIAIDIGALPHSPIVFDNTLQSAQRPFNLTPGSHAIRTLRSLRSIRGAWSRTDEINVRGVFDVRLQRGENIVLVRYRSTVSRPPAAFSIEYGSGVHRHRLIDDVAAPIAPTLQTLALFATVDAPLAVRLMVYGDGSDDILRSATVSQAMTGSTSTIVVPPFGAIEARRHVDAGTDIIVNSKVLRTHRLYPERLNELTTAFIEHSARDASATLAGRYHLYMHHAKLSLEPATAGVRRITVPGWDDERADFAIDSHSLRAGSGLELSPGVHRFVSARPTGKKLGVHLNFGLRGRPPSIYIPVNVPANGEWLLTLRYRFKSGSNLGAGFGRAGPAGSLKDEDTDLQADGRPHAAAFVVRRGGSSRAYLQIYGKFNERPNPSQFRLELAELSTAEYYRISETALLRPTSMLRLVPDVTLERVNEPITFQPDDTFSVTVKGTGLLRFSSPFNPEWKAFGSDGKELSRALVDGVFTGWLANKPGVIEFVYGMQRYRRLGLAIAALSVAFAAGALLLKTVLAASARSPGKGIEAPRATPGIAKPLLP